MKKQGMGTGLAIALTAGYVAAQGSLAPPGAPAPTMKTLGQVEPRTPISQTGYTISNSGSYYLATNLTTSGNDPGVRIVASDVSLDLCGFTINGAESTGNGISISLGVDNVSVHNGSVRSCCFHGLDAGYATHCIFRDLRIINNARNAISYCGIAAGANAQVERCRIVDNGGTGLSANSNSKIIDNEIAGNGGDGLKLIGAGTYVANNIVKDNGNNYDLDAGNQLNILLCETPETLEWPCSAKLAGTLTCTQAGTNGITVAANDVTIDLDGHALVGSGASSGNGIYQSDAYHNLTIKNGQIIHWEYDYNAAIYVGGSSSILSGLQVSSNYDGISTGSASVISRCTACDNNGIGLYADDGSTISDCTANYNGNQGIYIHSACTISDCVARYNAANGIYAYSTCTISGCSTRNNGSNGIHATNKSTILDCMAQHNTGDGIEVSYGSLVANCVCDGNGNGGDGAGIHAINHNNRIENNTVANNDRGIDVDANNNFIIKNSAFGNTTDYDIYAGNNTGTIQTTPVGAGAWDNFEF